MRACEAISPVTLLSCHREGRGDLDCPGRARREKRDCFAGSSFLSSQGTWRSRLFSAGKQSKERLPRCARNDKKYSPEGRTDLGCSGLARQKGEIASQARNDRTRAALAFLSSRGTWRSRLFIAGQAERRDCFAGNFVIARNVAISVVQGGQAERRDCFAGNSVIARNVAISPFSAGKQTKTRLLRRLAMTEPALRSPSCHREGRGDLVCS